MKSLAIVTILAKFAIADWEETEVRDDPWLTCETDSDCLEEHSCVNVMTASGYAEISSERGCVAEAKCAGTGSWDDDTQYFCNEEQQALQTTKCYPNLGTWVLIKRLSCKVSKRLYHSLIEY